MIHNYVACQGILKYKYTLILDDLKSRLSFLNNEHIMNGIYG